MGPYLRALVGAEEREVVVLTFALVGLDEPAVFVHAAREKLPDGNNVGLVPRYASVFVLLY